MAAEQTRGLCSYKNYLIYTSKEIDDVIKKHAVMVTRHIDANKGPYYHVTLKRQMTIPKLFHILGEEDVIVEPQLNVLEITRCDIATAKKEYIELIKRGKMILEVLNEDNTTEEVLNAKDRRAVKAYRRTQK